MPVRVPSKIVQLNDAIKFPVVTTLEIEVDDIEGLFTTQSGLSSGIGARGYKNLDEVLAQLSSGLILGGGGGLGSGIEVLNQGVSLGTYGKVNFSGLDVVAKQQSPDTAIVITDPSIRIQDDGMFLDRAKTINFSGTAFARVDVTDGVATVIVVTSGAAGGGIAGINVQDEGSAIGQFDTINFSGAGVIAREDGGKVSVIVDDHRCEMKKFSWFMRGPW